jgi:hypothetical protein
MKVKLLLALALALALVAALLAYLFVNYHKKQSVPNNINKITKLSDEDRKLYLGYKIYDSIDENLASQRDFFQKLADDINSTKKNETKSNTLLKEIIYFSHSYNTELAGASVDRKEALIKSFDGLYDLYNKVDDIAKEEGKNLNYLKQKIAISTEVVYFSSCYMYDYFLESKWANDVNYKSLLTQYPKNPRLATMLYFDTLYRDFDGSRDELVLVTRSYNLARILNHYDKELSDKDKFMMIESLNSTLQRASTANKTRLFGDEYGWIESHPSFYRAYSTHILSRYSKDISKEDVKKLYEKAINNYENTPDTNAKSKSTLPLYIARSAYAQYLFEINGNKINQDIKKIYDKNILYVLNVENTSPYLFNSFNFYISNTTSEMGSWDKFRTNDLLISKQYKPLADFLIKFGIK